MFKILTLVV